MSTTLATAYFWLILLLPIFGMILNGYVFWRLLRLAKRRRSRFECTSALPLAAMSLGDSITLMALFVQALFHKVDKTGLPHSLLNALCKADLYSMHSTSAFSVWCWFLLSVLRCIAVFKPLDYYTIWRQPRNFMVVLAFICIASESWILFFVVYSQDGKICVEDRNISQQLIQVAHTTDILLFYAIPSLARLVLDSTVLFHCYSPFTSIDVSLSERRLAISIPRKYSIMEDTVALRQSMALTHSLATDEQTSKKRALYIKRKTALIMRSIAISVLNLLLNLPAYILRVWNTFEDPNSVQAQQSLEIRQSIEPVCHLLYFSQFACNAFYLSIYESSSYTHSNRNNTANSKRLAGENAYSSHA
ncbi:hypothetical protein WR25_18570 [Diploscapter pachys]|uniref:G-protein coupled receptors family 1 profile domain-containing protein n=1 Tax=Diploscapter pachys TaxID=2018661 RepID=A0A2A2K8I0_9BILA|nr:hypothetical protein WR25_18570 [Diploscapter pachys]